MKKKLGAIILVAAMLLSLFAIPAAAANVGDFSDVSEGAWYYDAVKFTIENDFFKGTSVTEKIFEPNTAMTRAMFVTVLLRMENWLRVDENAKREAKGDSFRAELIATEGEAELSFADAASIPAWAAKAVEWAAKEGIIKGFADNTFRSDEPVIREDMARMIKRYVDYHNKANNAEVKGIETPVDYADIADRDEEAKSAIEECTDKGILIGWDSNDGVRNFWPIRRSTRAEVSQVFVRLVSTVKTEDTPPTPPPTEYVTISYDANQPIDKILTYGVMPLVDKANELASKVYNSADSYVDKVEVKIGNWDEEDNSRKDIIGGSYDEIAVVGGTTVENPASQTVAKGSTVTVAAPLTVAGFTFDGWYDENGAKWEGSKTLNQDVKLTAKWTASEEPIEITVSADANLGEDFIDAIIVSAGYAATVLTTDGKDQVKDLYTRVEETVKELLQEYGLYDEATELWDTVKTTTSIRKVINKVYDLAYEFVTTKGPAYWANFRDENGYYFDKATLTVAGQDFKADTNSGNGPTNFYTGAGDKKVAAKAVAKQFAKDMEAQLRTYTEPTSQVTLTYGATVKFDVNANGDYSNPNYVLKATLNLDAKDQVQYYYDTEAKSYTFIANVDTDDVKDLMQTVAEALCPKADQLILDKLSLDENYNGIKGSLYRSLVTGSTPGEILDLLDSLDVGIDVDSYAADYGIDLKAHPGVKDYVLAALCDFYYKKALEVRANYAENSSDWYKWSPESYVEDERPADGFVTLYEGDMLQDAASLTFGALADALTKDVVVDKIGTSADKFMENASYIVNKFPASVTININGKKLTKGDFAELLSALEAKDLSATLKAFANLMKKDALKDLTIADFVTKDATSGGKTAVITFRSYTRNVTLRILDVNG